MALLANVLIGLLLAASLVLTFAALRSWYYARTIKVAMLGGGFAVLAGKAGLISYALFTNPAWKEEMWIPVLFMDAVALALFYGSVLVRTPR